MERSRPFWEDLYGNLAAPGAFGPPSAEIIELADMLPKKAEVLDLGCGDGRHAIYLAEHGFRVTAIDVSPRGIHKLQHNALQRGLTVETEVRDLRHLTIEGTYDLIIAHGCLHLVEPPHSSRLLKEMKAGTRAGGYNVVAVFTDAIEPPEDLQPFMRGVFHEGDLFEAYSGWQIKEARSYTLEDDHPGGNPHRHAIDKLLARKPGIELA